MNAFDLIGASAPRPLPKWLPQVGALLAAGTVALFACRLPPLHTISWGELIGSAVACVLDVLLASAVAAWGICAISSRVLALDTRRLILRTSLAVLWIAPLALLIRENSSWAIVIVAVLVASVVKSICLPQDHLPQDHRQADFQTDVPADAQQSTVIDPNRSPFSLLESAPSFRLHTVGFGAVLCTEAGVVLALAGHPLTAAALVGVGSAVWTWSYTREAVLDPREFLALSRSPSSSRTLSVVALAIVITAAALLRYLPQSFGVRGFSIPSRNHTHQGLPDGDRRAELARARPFDDSDPPIRATSASS
jgi:hypothetical protein